MAVREVAVTAAPRGLRAGVALLSAAVLGMQVLATRLFSFTSWHHLTYMVVTVTLLGFAAGGSLLAVAPRLGRAGGEARTAVALHSVAFALTLLGALALIARDPVDALDLERARGAYFWLCLRYGYLLVPFVCAGLAIAAALQADAAGRQRVYVWHLIGSAVGTLLFFALIRPLGGAGSVFAFAACGALASLAASAGVAGRGARAARILGGCALGLCAVALARADLAEAWLPLRPARSKALTLLGQYYGATEAARRAHDPAWPGVDASLRHTVWGPLCRIDTVPMPREPGAVARDAADPAGAPRSQVHLFQDGDAPTVVWSRGHAAEHDPRSTPYWLGYDLLSRPDVLVIGPGGGSDVHTALLAGARAVTAVEVNGDTLALLRGPLADYTGHLYDRPAVTAVHAEGRAFLRRLGDRRFDLIVMSGTDTYAALASGSYVFSESYLYTVEAFADLLAHLHEDGLLHVLRFGFVPPREELRLVATAAQALADLGIHDPRRHVVVVEQEDRQGQVALTALRASAAHDTHAERMAAVLAQFAQQPMRYAIVLVRKRPFTPADVQTLARALPAMNANPAVTHELAYDGGAGVAPQAAASAYGRLLAAMAHGDVGAFYASYPYRVTPATDDRPFFFHFHAWRDLLAPRSERDSGYAALTGSEPIGLFVLAALTLQTVLATVLLVLAPLVRAPLRAAGGHGRALAYFGCLGAGYFLVEIATTQRFVLYLGHPTSSLAANVTTFLLASAAGAATAQARGCGARGAALACAAVIVQLATHALLLPSLLHATLAAPAGVRVLTSCLATAPLAFAMGMPFPTGLALLRHSPALLPWAFGVNAAASVLASVLAVALAMELGFTTVLALAATAYGVALLAAPRPATPDRRTDSTQGAPSAARRARPR